MRVVILLLVMREVTVVSDERSGIAGNGVCSDCVDASDERSDSAGDGVCGDCVDHVRGDCADHIYDNCDGHAYDEFVKCVSGEGGD